MIKWCTFLFLFLKQKKNLQYILLLSACVLLVNCTFYVYDIALLGSKELLIEDNYKILRVSTLFLRFFKYMLVAILIIIFIMVCLIIIKKWRDEHLSNHILYLLGYRNVHIYLLMTGMWLIFLLFSCGLGFLFSSTVINNILSNVLQKKLELSIHIPYHAYLKYAGNSSLIITPMILLANFFVIRTGRSGRYKI